MACTGALWELHQRALEAKGFRAACLHLASYVRAILTVFNAEGGGNLTRLQQGIAVELQLRGYVQHWDVDMWSLVECRAQVSRWTGDH